MLLITVGIPWRVAITRLVVVSLGIALPLVLLPLTVPDGTARALQIATRAITIAMLGLVVLHTTPFADLLAALQRLRVPGVLLQIVQLAYRYTFEFFVVFRQMRIALFTRGFRWRASGRLYQTMGQAMGSLVVRGGEQSERVSDAMLARGYSGKFHTLTLFHTHSMDLLKCLVAVILVVVLLALEWLT
jgi:cobalt/nickel transport system permease protein